MMSSQTGASNLDGLYILLVCEANICRSPVIAFALGSSVALHVSSVGLNAREGSAICNLAAEKIAEKPGGRDFINSFGSHVVDWAAAGRADLIITATAELRSKLLVREPRFLGVTFTALEVIALMAEPLDEAELETLQGDGIAAVLSGRRGLIVVPAVPVARGRRRHDPFDLPDGHQFRLKRHHQATVVSAMQIGRELQTLLLDWWSALDTADTSGHGHEKL